jgi:Amt family ammonium transporter
LSPCQGEFANGLTQDNWLSQVIFQFFGWIIVMAFTFIFSLILWLIIGNVLYYSVSCWEQVKAEEQINYLTKASIGYGIEKRVGKRQK